MAKKKDVETEKKLEDMNEIERGEVLINVPSFDSDEWSDYVLSQLREDEKFNNHPTVDGLRRLTNKLVGPIIRSEVRVIASPSLENEHRATVEYTVEVSTTLFKDKDMGITFLRYTAAADAYRGNTLGEFAKHPVAIAETRAEGRALRKLLRLQKVVTADEVPTNVGDDVQNAEPITDTQIQFIELMCSKVKLNLDVEKFVKLEYPNAKTLKTLTREQALKLQEKFNDYQRDNNSIPEDIKGYKEWA